MARETKIGLLAGLAFIICFAVILSQRGRSSRPSQSIFQRGTQTTQGKPKRRPMISPSRREVLPGNSTPVGPGQLVTHSPDDSQHTSKPFNNDTMEPSGSGADVNLPGWVKTTDSSGDVRQPPENFSPDESNTSNEMTSAARNVQPMDAKRRRQLLEQRLVELNHQNNKGNVQGNHFQTSRKPQSVDFENDPPFKVKSTPNSHAKNMGLRYIVVSGDSLSKIAIRYYGVESHRHIDAIFNANRKVMANPDTLKVGMVLWLPGVKKSSKAGQQQAAKTQPRRSKNSFVKRNQPGQTYRWYQIKKNDRYASIAREQLGDANRWRELYELNREKFPDPQRIREGVRIKIPTRSSKMVSRNGS